MNNLISLRLNNSILNFLNLAISTAKVCRFQVLAFTIFAITISLSAFTQGQDAPLKNWRGDLKVKAAGIVVQTVKLQLLLADDPESADSQMVTINQKGLGFPFDEFSFVENEIKFKIKPLGAEFNGKLNEAKNEISGKFKQAGLNLPLTLKLESTAKHTATKTGIMKAGTQSFDFQFRFFTDEKDQKFALLDSFSENVGSLICQVKEKDGELTIVVPNTQAKFVAKAMDGDKAKIDKTGEGSGANKISGEWIQRSAKIPLALTDVAIEETRKLKRKVVTANRPQTPKAPFPYEVEEFTVSLQEVNPKHPPISIAGTLTIPAGEGPFPAVVLISGSGPQDRDETIFDHKPFWVIADHLSRNGFAVLRYDERGVGKSTGEFNQANSIDLAADAELLFTWLGKNPKIDKTKIALIGHSEGGYIAPMIAARNPTVAAIVSLAGPGVKGSRILLSQQSKLAKVMGASDETVEFNLAFNGAILERMEKGEPFNSEFKTKLKSEMTELWKQKIKSDMPPALIDATIATYSAPWMKLFVLHDPSVDLAKTKCPVLCLIGENDLQVDADLNIPEIKEALKKAGNTDFKVKRLPKLNHLFQQSETGAVAEYGKIEETFDLAVLKEMSNWLSKRLK